MARIHLARNSANRRSSAKKEARDTALSALPIEHLDTINNRICKERNFLLHLQLLPHAVYEKGAVRSYSTTVIVTPTKTCAGPEGCTGGKNEFFFFFVLAYGLKQPAAYERLNENERVAAHNKVKILIVNAEQIFCDILQML